ncbi:lactonase family protein [Sporolactobacillus sp. CPB3-1]|uniref:Lactonase family protein n=1 Tax=Sporolactobacillus mangiferae TaxID=2940498 RepID=A0ABT0MA42_9BACL|nr:lactonase family protein [Sporolactobacillus mangiferae]MCL1631210.1 lactonase family protein [Sporolactobacillus mangiferae]
MSQFKGYIGTYTKGTSEGIYSFVLNTERKELSELRVAAKVDNPTYLTLSSDNRHLYSVEKKESTGGVGAFTVGASGELEYIGAHLSEGAPPCYVAVDQAGTHILDANYHRGTAALYKANSGKGVRLMADVKHQGSEALSERQEEPHVHFTGFTPDERFVVTVDLGLDALTTYDLSEGQWVEQNTLIFKQGSGPRHLAFHPNAPYAYVMTELSSEVVALRFDADRGAFTAFQTISALPAGYTGHSQGAAIKISADGRFVYVSNRGHNSIAVFQVGEENGKLALIEHVATMGDWPRDFEIDPSGQFLLVANQNSGNLVLFERDTVTGRLHAQSSVLAVADAVCVKFLHY